MVASGVNLPYCISTDSSAVGAADMINHPPHYVAGGIETIDFIEAKGFGYHLASVIKYVSRAGRKSTSTYIQDLEKAAWYLARAIVNAKSAAERTSRT